MTADVRDRQVRIALGRTRIRGCVEFVDGAIAISSWSRRSDGAQVRVAQGTSSVGADDG